MPPFHAEKFQDYACYGPPVRHPASGRLEGVLVFVSRAAEASPLMLAFIEETASYIQEQMLTTGSRRERLLVDAFVTAERGTRSAVVALDEQTIIASAATSALLEQGLDHAALWEAARGAIEGRGARGEAGETLCGEGDRAVRVTASPVLDGNQVVGALVRLSGPAPAGPPAAGCRGRSVPPQQRLPQQRLPQLLLRRLGGHSRAWVRAMSEAAPAAASHHPVLLLGEPGTGKLEVARALHDLSGVDGPLSVFNAALALLDGFAVWLGRVRARLGLPGTVVLAHLETLSGTEALALAALLDEHEGSPSRPIGTVTRHPGEAWPAGPHLDRLAIHSVGLPPLRERRGDVPDLVRRLARRHGDDRLRFTPQAMRVLAGAPWPANVRQLETLVRRLAVQRRPTDVGLRDLPPDLLTEAGPVDGVRPLASILGSVALTGPDLAGSGLAEPGPTEPLTSREREVLGLLAVGRANRDIAGELVVTLDTVKRHVSHILAKLGAANRTEAVARARELDLIP
jgi:sigma-54 dependent transcriptional regulator, acetoin dehydrogenase operon transcriptional activator AcoR